MSVSERCRFRFLKEVVDIEIGTGEPTRRAD